MKNILLGINDLHDVLMKSGENCDNLIYVYELLGYSCNCYLSAVFNIIGKIWLINYHNIQHIASANGMLVNVTEDRMYYVIMYECTHGFFKPKGGTLSATENTKTSLTLTVRGHFNETIKIKRDNIHVIIK